MISTFLTILADTILILGCGILASSVQMPSWLGPQDVMVILIVLHPFMRYSLWKSQKQIEKRIDELAVRIGLDPRRF